MESKISVPSFASANPAMELRAAWQPALRDSYDDAERALESLIELGLRASEGESTSLLALGAALSVAVDKLEAHHDAVEAGAAIDWGRPASMVSRHIEFFRKLQLRNLDKLTELLRHAPDGASLAQAVIVTGVVMLQDWYAHGRLLSALAEPPLSTFS